MLPKLQLEDISKTFHRPGASKETDAMKVLQNINLSIPEGGFVSIIGPSGCGKSTLLRIVDGLIKPDGGRVLVDGGAVDRPGPDRAVVFQYFGLYPWRTVQRNVEFGLELRCVDKHERAKRARDSIDRVGLKGFEAHYPHELSGGMRQRVGLARALTSDPDIILLDEPFSAVDEQTREILQHELLTVWAQTRKTILFITHSIDEAVYISDTIIVMGTRPGRIEKIIDVDLPRPRDDRTRALPRFGEIRTYAWEILKRGIKASQELVVQ